MMVCSKITTSNDHELIAQDEIIVSSKVITDNTNKHSTCRCDWY